MAASICLTGLASLLRSSNIRLIAGEPHSKTSTVTQRTPQPRIIDSFGTYKSTVFLPTKPLP